MRKYRYACLDEKGQRQDGIILARHREQAELRLAGRGWRLQQLSPVDSAPAPAPLRPLTPPEAARFFSHLSVMVGSGVPIARALEVASEGREVILEVLQSVLAGNRFSAALEVHPKSFPPVLLATIRVGEETGGLVEALHSLSRRMLQGIQRRQRLLAALIYPCAVLVAMGSMLAFFLYFMVPRFMAMYTGELPGLTRFVLALSNPLVLLGGAGLAVLVVALSARRSLLERALYHGPFRRLAALFVMVGTARSLALLLHYGVELTRALKLVTRPSTGWSELDLQLRELADAIVSTGELEAPLRRCDLLPPVFRQMFLIGLTASRPADFLNRYAAMAEFELEAALETVLVLVEPILLAASGLAVGLIVVACFLPVYNLLGTL